MVSNHEKKLAALSKETENRAKRLMLPLLNSLQKRLKDPLVILYCNGDVWLGTQDWDKRGRLTNISDVMIQSAYKFQNHPPSKEDKRYMHFFPELEKMGKIIAAVGEFRSCGFPEVKPTVKPRKS